MSGKDERPIKDIPVCPMCGKKPDFWILNVSRDKWFWLFSDNWLETRPNFAKVTFSRDTREGDVYKVHTVRCVYYNDATSHRFSRNSSDPNCIVRECTELMKYYVGVGSVRMYERPR